MKRVSLWLLVLLIVCVPAFAHPGATDSKGGHYDRSTGEYHYHHGKPAHQHEGGVCPYDFATKEPEEAYHSSGGSTSVIAALRAAEPKDTSDLPISTPPSTSPILLLWFGAGLGVGVLLLIWQSRRAKARMEEAVARQRRIDEAEWRPKLEAADKSIQELAASNKAEIEQRREIASGYLRQAFAAHNLLTRICKLREMIEAAPQPDLSEGVVYLPYDLSSSYFHNDCSDCNVVAMMLVSKHTAISVGLKQCPHCKNMPQPVWDTVVLTPFSRTGKYHRVGSFCGGYLTNETTLSKAKALGLQPCQRCNPPKENPKVWF